MLVSWDWLKEYVPLDMTPAEAAERPDDGRAEP